MANETRYQVSDEAINTMLATGNPYPFFNEVNKMIRSRFPKASRQELKLMSEIVKGIDIRLRNQSSDIVGKVRRGEQKQTF